MPKQVNFARIGDILAAEVDVEKDRIKELSLQEFREYLEKVLNETKLAALVKYSSIIDSLLRANEKAKKIVEEGGDAVVISPDAEAVLTYAKDNIRGISLEVSDDEINFVIPNERGAMMLEYGTSEIPPIPFITMLREAIYESASSLAVAKMLGVEHKVQK